MPSLFTHALVGASISTLAPQPVRGVRLAVILAAVAAAPDLDVLAFRFGVPYASPLGHRGFTHSLAFAFLVALLLYAWMARPLRGPSSKVGFFAVLMLACASHGLLDAFTDAGLGVGFFIPFSDYRYFFPWRPILTSPLSVGAFFSERGVAILGSEVAWVWLPVALVVALAHMARRHSDATPSG